LCVHLGLIETEQIASPQGLAFQVEKAVKEGERQFVAAGGDGTVHLLLNALMRSADCAHELALGAVGLGSSNDSHKPLRPEAYVRGIPVRLDFTRAVPQDVIHVSYVDDGGEARTRFCLNNASIGVTAEANAIYNSGDRLIALARRICTEAAIVVAALKAVFAHRNVPYDLTINETQRRSHLVTNLGIIKNRHFAGGMSYDSPIERDDGKLGVNLCEEMRTLDVLRTLLSLYRGRFRGLPKTRVWVATRLLVGCGGMPFALEMDGEVVHATQAEFAVLPRAIRYCQ
jgi:diacylglycerol kinase family enzyme